MFSVRVAAMSSSKIFKQDPHFTPIPLVQHHLVLPKKGSKPATADQLSTSSSESLPPLKAGLDASRANPEPQAELEPAPTIDLQAIREEAYNQGMADLAAQYQAETRQTVAAFAEACQKIDNHRKQLLQQSRSDIINFIITLSKRIIGQELAMPRNVIAATLQAALEQAIENEEYHVTLNPEDLTFAEEKVPELITSIRGLERIVFKTDAAMTRGGCLLESTVCSVDATIEMQLESMKEFLEEQPTLLPASVNEELLSSRPAPEGESSEA